MALIVGCGASLSQTEDAFVAKLAGGCEDLKSCRALASEAALRLENCNLSCDSEQRDQLRARDLLRQALEDDVERKFAASKQRRERKLALEERNKRRASEKAEQRRRDETESAHRRKLELIRAEGEQRRKAQAARRAQRVQYLGRLSADQRLARLKQCHLSGERCDGLTELLAASAENAADKRNLVDLNEQLRDSGGAAQRCGSAPNDEKPLPAAAPRTPERPVEKSAVRVQPAQCCDGTIAIGCTCGNDSAACCATNGGACGCAG